MSAAISAQIDRGHGSRRLAISVSVILVLGVAAMGLLILEDFNDSLQPELDRRAALIGATIRDDTQRALALGIPAQELVGVEDYFAVFLGEFPELDYLALRDSDLVLMVAVGRAAAGPGGSADWVPIDESAMSGSVVHRFTVPGLSGGESSIDVGVDSGYVRSRLDDLALDVAVILIVALVVAFEVTLAVSGRLSRGATPAADGTSRGRIHNPGDIRLILLVFAIGEELNKSFLPLFIKSADNPIAGLDANIAISLPIVAYLLTMAVASPLAGRVRQAVGQRRLFLIGVGASATSHLGMVFAGNVLQIVGLRALTGLGYALATIACLEYVLERLSPGNRARSVAVFITVVMGGTFAGTALGGIFADRLGFDAVFLISFGLLIAAGWAATRTMEPEPSTRGADRTALSLRDLVSVLRERSLRLLLAGVTIPMNVLAAAFLWYLVPLTMSEYGADASTIARTLMLYYLVILIGGSIAGRVAGSRFALRPFVGAGSLIAAAALFLPAIGASTFTFAFAVLVVGAGHAAIRGPQIALALEIAEVKLAGGGRDAAMAAMRTLERLGSLVGLLVISVVAARFGLQTAIGVVGVLGVVAAVVFTLTSDPAVESIDA